MNFKSWLTVIKNTVTIEEVLEAVGIKHENGKMLCPNPDHNDRHLGSCSYDIDKGTYKCWACGDSGDIFSIVEKKMGYGFNDAVNFIINYHNAHSATKIYRDYDKSVSNGFTLSNNDLKYLEMETFVHCSVIQGSENYKPSENWLKEQSDPGTYVYGNNIAVRISDIYSSAPQTVKALLYNRAKEIYIRNIEAYESRFWIKTDSVEKQRKAVEKKHYIEESFNALQKIFAFTGVQQPISFPQIINDSAVKCSLKISL